MSVSSQYQLSIKKITQKSHGSTKVLPDKNERTATYSYVGVQTFSWTIIRAFTIALLKNAGSYTKVIYRSCEFLVFLFALTRINVPNTITAPARINKSVNFIYLSILIQQFCFSVFFTLGFCIVISYITCPYETYLFYKQISFNNSTPWFLSNGNPICTSLTSLSSTALISSIYL